MDLHKCNLSQIHIQIQAVKPRPDINQKVLPSGNSSGADAMDLHMCNLSDLH